MKRTAFTITRTRDGVFLTEETSDGDKCTRVADPIKVRSIGTRLADKVTLVEIRFKTIHGDYRSEMFPFSYLQRERWGEIKVRVGDQGYKWPEDQNVVERNPQAAGGQAAETQVFSGVGARAGTNPNLCCPVRCSARRGAGRTTASIPTPTLTSGHSCAARDP